MFLLAACAVGWCVSCGMKAAPSAKYDVAPYLQKADEPAADETGGATQEPETGDADESGE